jgi:hypothetical protein
LCCGDGFGYGSSGAQANDALNVGRRRENADALQWFCFVPIDHQVPEKWLFRSKDGHPGNWAAPVRHGRLVDDMPLPGSCHGTRPYGVRINTTPSIALYRDESGIHLLLRLP